MRAVVQVWVDEGNGHRETNPIEITLCSFPARFVDQNFRKDNVQYSTE